MRIKMNILGAAVALAVSGATQAGTSPILFDYNGAGAGGQIIVGSFDWTPDNALAVGAVPLATNPLSNTFDLYAQGALGNFTAADGLTPILGTGLNSTFEITYQTGFTETGTAITTAGVGANAIFSLAPVTPVNFFNIYYDTNVATFANQIAGTGYGNGTLILSGVVAGNTTSFFIPFIKFRSF